MPVSYTHLDVYKRQAQGCDALIVLPVDDGSSEPIVEKAHAENVPVISYDQIVLNADLDYNVTFDSTEVGKKMASYAVDKAPKGKYVLLCGGQASNNATPVSYTHLDRTETDRSKR